MGRKKSKTQKKKQSKKAGHKLAKVFAKKLGVGDVDTMRIETGKSATTPDSSSSATPRKSCSQKLMAKLSREKAKKAAAAAASGDNDEGAPHMRDFLRQQASLREREMRIEWKRNIVRKCRSNNNNGKITIQLTPASFAATDAEKSVDQLVGETTQKVGNWNGLDGGSTPRKSLPNFSTPFSTPISQSAPEAWSPDAVNVANQPNVDANPWAVLADVEDDDGDKNNNKRGSNAKDHMTVALLPPPSIPVAQAFSFAPPSFSTSMAPTAAAPAPTAFAAAAVPDDGIDPDDL